MKFELIVALTLMNLSIGGRQQRSTVLTDESKRILEQFDFSNFDKQEALNYIDRQRYDNQIRGKRSRPKVRSDFTKKTIVTDGETSKNLNSNITEQNQQICDTLISRVEKPLAEGSEYCDCPLLENIESTISNRGNLRIKRGHRHKKKHKLKHAQRSNEGVDEDDYDEDEADEERYLKRKKKKKKKKRHYWNKWSRWSPCSVTCGRGRKIRWRKCIAKNCTTGELEMGEKTCQLPACSLLTKLLGL